MEASRQEREARERRRQEEKRRREKVKKEEREEMIWNGVEWAVYSLPLSHVSGCPISDLRTSHPLINVCHE